MRLIFSTDTLFTLLLVVHHKSNVGDGLLELVGEKQLSPSSSSVPVPPAHPPIRPQITHFFNESHNS